MCVHCYHDSSPVHDVHCCNAASEIFRAVLGSCQKVRWRFSSSVSVWVSQSSNPHIPVLRSRNMKSWKACLSLQSLSCTALTDTACVKQALIMKFFALWQCDLEGVYLTVCFFMQNMMMWYFVLGVIYNPVCFCKIHSYIIN